MTTQIRKYLGDFLWITALFIVSIGVTIFILGHQKTHSRFPLLQSRFEVKIDLSDASAVTPGQGQTIVVAGVNIGKLSKVELQQGHAVVTADIKPQYRSLIHSDATALLRPRTGLKDMFIELDPGTDRAPLMSNNSHIPLRNTAPDVNSDEILATLDRDTRDYLQLLINGAGKGLENHGGDLRSLFARFEPLHRDLARVTGAIAERRRNLATLVHNYGQLTTELGRQPKELMTLVDASNAALSAFAQENQNISSAVHELPGALTQTKSTLDKVNRLGTVLGPSFDSLRPAFRQLNTSNHEVLPFVREAEPITRTQIRPFVRAARGPVRDLRPAAQNLSRALPDLTTAFFEFNRFFNLLAHNPKGRENISDRCERDGQCTTAERDREEGYLYWLAYAVNNTDNLFSTGDAEGPFRPVGLILDCSSLTALQQQNPLFAPIAGFSGLLASGACPTSSSKGATQAPSPPVGAAGKPSPGTPPAAKAKAAGAPKPAAPKPGAPPKPAAPAKAAKGQSAAPGQPAPPALPSTTPTTPRIP